MRRLLVALRYITLQQQQLCFTDKLTHVKPTTNNFSELNMAKHCQSEFTLIFLVILEPGVAKI